MLDKTSKKSEILITVVFATFNGGDKLQKMLEAFCELTLDHKLWKVVAVDNGSTDSSFTLLEEYRDRLPMSVLSETMKGKGNALDQAFLHLDGNLTVFTDDDVLPDPNWLDQYIGIANEMLDYDIFSGLIDPQWEETPPAWLLECVDLATVFAINSKTPEGPISPHKIFGPNCAFRTNILPTRYNVLATSVGPNSSNSEYAMGGDTALALYLNDLGYKCFHTRRARVRHIIPKSYLRETWILGRAKRSGRGFVHAHPDKINYSQLMAHIFHLGNNLLFRASMILPHSQLRWKILWNSSKRMGIYAEILDDLKLKEVLSR